MILQQSIKDYFSAKFLTLTLISLIAPFCILISLWFYGGFELFSFLQNGGDIHQIFFDESSIFETILKFSFIQWLLSGMLFGVGFLGLVYISIALTILFLGFLTPIVVKQIHQKYYPNIHITQCGFFDTFMTILIIFLKFLLIFVMTLPFMWIPLTINIPFFYLFYEFMRIDIGSNMMDKKRLKFFLKKHSKEIFWLSLCFFTLSLIPFFGMILQLFFVIYFTHFYFQKELNYEY